MHVSGEIFASTWNVQVRSSPIGEARVRALTEAALADVEEQLSLWKPDSALSRYNREQREVSEAFDAPTVDVLARAVQVTRQSRGAFDLAWNAPARVVDATSITDAAAAEAVLRALKNAGVRDVLVNVAGEVTVAGDWNVAVEAPSALTSPIAIADVALSSQALSTSAVARARHIIDPRTRAPAVTSLVSCTVVGDDVVIADAWSTACIVLGEAETRALLPAGYQALFVDVDGRITQTAGLRLQQAQQQERAP